MAEKKLPVVTLGVDDIGRLGFRALSYVDFPANVNDFVFMNKQRQKPIYLKSEERRMVYGPVLIPDQLIYRVDEETGQEYYITFKAETIRDVAYRMMKQGLQGKHTVMHEVEVDGCYITENWLKEYDQDKSVALGFDLPVGTWFVGSHVENNAVWESIKSGEFRGFSIEAYFDEVSVSMSDEKLLAELQKILKE